MSAEALERLIAQIDNSFDRPEGGRGETVARGLYQDSWFYPAHGRFHLFNTCNTWTARIREDLQVNPPDGEREGLLRTLSLILGSPEFQRH